MEIKKIVMLVRQVRWQEVEFSTDTGHEMPETASEFLQMCEEIKGDPLHHTSDGDWQINDDGSLIREFEIVEAD